MICSGLINVFLRKKVRKTTISFMMLVILTVALCFCVFAPAVSAEKESVSSTVDSVNLTENKWVYSVYINKSGSRYAAVTRYDGDEIDIVIPESLGGIPVKTISREAFCGGKYITSVTIPDGVTEIGKYAFSGCVGLRSVKFPATLRSVGEGAFYGCISLTEAVFPEGTVKIDSFSFYNCLHLRTAAFPSTLRSIGDSSFENCGMLERVSFGKELEKIGDTAFKGCTALDSADISGVSELGVGAFLNCHSLKSITLGDNIADIRPETFRGCESLRKITFGSAITKIGKSAFEDCVSLNNLPRIDSLSEICSLAFYGCTSLKKAELGTNLERIENGAFTGCTSLSKINVAEDNENFYSESGCLYSRDNMRLILCPQGHKGILKLSESASEISDYAVADCADISDVVFNEGLSRIGKAAFLGCTDLSSVSLPDSLESMDSAALGSYFFGGKIKKTEYLTVYSSKGGCAEKYCTDRNLTFVPYGDTLHVSSERVVLEEGKSFKLTGSFLSRKKADISWESSDESVVKVSGGRLTAVSQGSAEVTVSAEGFEPRTVKVETIPVGTIGTSKERTSDTKILYCGESEELSSIFSQIIDPIFASNRFWYSSDPSVATVTNDGKVTAHCRGKANITCRMPDGSENNVLITVTEKPSDFYIESPIDELIVGGSVIIGKNIYPTYSTDDIKWESDDESVATVDKNGAVTAVSQGKCDITAIAASGLKSTITVKCVKPAESVSLDREKRNVYVGKQFNLVVSLTPEDSMRKVTWSSSDPSVASVNSKGKVTGKSFGSAVIYASTLDGITAECAVNVIVRAEELNLDNKKLVINRGELFKLNSIIRPSYSPETTDKCVWNSTDEKVATVDDDGNVTAVGVGRCIINCRTSGDLISKCQVQVRLPAESVEISSEKDSLYINEVQQLKAVVVPTDATDSIEWISSNEDIAKVTSNGVVKGKSAGTAVITVKFTNDVTGESVTADYQITIMKKAESVRLNKTSLFLLAGENDSLSFTVSPDDSNDTIRWYSTDESVATVRNDGLITAVSTGSCLICIETGSGAVAKCKVSVK